jgi:hypothetical protein
MADFQIMALGRGRAGVLLLLSYRFSFLSMLSLCIVIHKVLIDATFGSIPFPCTMSRTLLYIMHLGGIMYDITMTSTHELI